MPIPRSQGELPPLPLTKHYANIYDVMPTPPPDPLAGSLAWLFLDMNSYFAAVEQQFRPELRGRPVGVIPTQTEHTCCIAASVEAKRHGVRTGTMVREARALCPGIQIVKARPDFYVEVHHRIKQAIDKQAPITKVYSIDECSIRLLGRERRDSEAVTLAKRIKRQVAEDVGEYLTCSVGIAPTRLLAKIACELKKPDGLTVLHVDDLPGALTHLQLDDLTGIGRGMLTRLRRHHVHDVETLWQLDKPAMRAVWGGVQGEHYWCGLHGIDAPEVAHHRHSMSHAHILPPELRTEHGARAIMTRLLTKAGHRLRHHGYFTRCLHASIRYESGTRWRDAIDLPTCQDTLTLVEHFHRLWRRRRVVGKPKKVAIALSGLTAADRTTGLLFPGAHDRQNLAHAMDRINRRFGNHSVYFADMHDTRHAMDDKIAFGRLPDEEAMGM